MVGNSKSLHLDCWGAVDQADGYDIALGPVRSEQSEMKLFFLNLGGYDPDSFGELHRNVLIVATDVKAAIVRSLGQVRPWLSPHRDKAFEVEKSLNLSETLFDREIALTLTPAVTIRPFRFTSRYLRLS